MEVEVCNFSLYFGSRKASRKISQAIINEMGLHAIDGTVAYGAIILV
jgi:hypothetical protein